MYKLINNISRFALGEFFIRNESGSNLHSQLDLLIPLVTIVRKGLSSLKYYGTVIWNYLPYDTRNVKSLVIFRNFTELHKLNICSRRM